MLSRFQQQRVVPQFWKYSLLFLLEDEELLTRYFVWSSCNELTGHFQVPCLRLSSQTGAWETWVLIPRIQGKLDVLACICNPCTHTERPEGEEGASQKPVSLDLLFLRMLQKTETLPNPKCVGKTETHVVLPSTQVPNPVYTCINRNTHMSYTYTRHTQHTGFCKRCQYRERERRKNHVTPILFCRGTLRLCYLKTRKLPTEDAFNTTL